MTLRIFILGVGVFFATLTFFYLSIASPAVISMWWWDMPMHALGGAWAGLIAAWFIVISRKEPTALECVAFAVFCGAAIELLEFLTGFGVSLFMHPTFDLVKDFIFDALGGYAAYASVRALRSI